LPTGLHVLGELQAQEVGKKQDEKKHLFLGVIHTQFTESARLFGKFFCCQIVFELVTRPLGTRELVVLDQRNDCG
jgi:hypothetical protein